VNNIERSVLGHLEVANEQRGSDSLDFSLVQMIHFAENFPLDKKNAIYDNWKYSDIV